MEADTKKSVGVMSLSAYHSNAYVIVPEGGLEPPLSLQEMDFESIASADSATPAWGHHGSRRISPFKNS